jgi:hypothetical protein
MGVNIVIKKSNIDSLVYCDWRILSLSFISVLHESLKPRSQKLEQDIEMTRAS